MVTQARHSYPLRRERGREGEGERERGGGVDKREGGRERNEGGGLTERGRRDQEYYVSKYMVMLCDPLIECTVP